MAENTKLIYKGFQARSNLVDGLIKAADIIGSTLGPQGKTVIIDSPWGSPKITKDGVTVAKNIKFSDPIADLAAKLVSQTAQKTDDNVGDGTTTSSVLVKQLLQEGYKRTAHGQNANSIRRGMEKAHKQIIEVLNKQTRQINSEEDIRHIATISANGDKLIGEKIADAIQKVGKDGVITVEEGKTLSPLTSEIVQGMCFDRGYISPYFADPGKKEVIFDKPKILICENKISNIKSLLPLLELLLQHSPSTPLVIIAEDVDGDALPTLTLNKIRGSLRVAAVKAPGFGDKRKEMLRDIAYMTGAQVISEELGMKLENTTLDALGSAKKVRIEKNRTIIIDGEGSEDSIKERIESIREAIKEADSEYDREKLQERLARLAGGIAVLKVGGSTEVEVKERKDRVEDALNATQAAVDEGIVAGGGSALYYSAESLKDLEEEDEDENSGIQIVRQAVSAPIKRIVKNAGYDSGVLLKELDDKKDKEMIIDALDGKIKNAFKAGIIDPVKVVKSAITDSISIASVVMTTEGLIVDDPKNDDNKNDNAAGGMGDMGGMGF